MEIGDSECYRYAVMHVWLAARESRGQGPERVMPEESVFLSRSRTWDAFFEEPRVAEFRHRLYLEAFGEEYPADEATDGYITRSELREMVGALHVGRGQKIADLGCGRDGPGQWIAGTTGSALVGIDCSAVALDQARARAHRLGVNCSYRSAGHYLRRLHSCDAIRLARPSTTSIVSLQSVYTFGTEPFFARSGWRGVCSPKAALRAAILSPKGELSFGKALSISLANQTSRVAVRTSNQHRLRREDYV
jgi:hypothetical protein